MVPRLQRCLCTPATGSEVLLRYSSLNMRKCVVSRNEGLIVSTSACTKEVGICGPGDTDEVLHGRLSPRFFIISSLQDLSVSTILLGFSSKAEVSEAFDPNQPRICLVRLGRADNISYFNHQYRQPALRDST